MNFIDLAKKRKSVRGFLDKEIPEQLIMEMLQAAIEAPSAGCCEPWHFFVIRDRAVIERIHNESCGQSFLLTAPLLIVVCTDVRRNEQHYGERGRTLYALQDTAAAIQNILLCSTDNGLGSCWCGAFDEDAASSILGLDRMRPVAIVPIGYYEDDPLDENARKPERWALEESVTFI